MSDPTGSVLDLLLEHHPALLSVEEVIREITAGADAFDARDRIEVAVRRLVETGLVHRLGSFVFASHAAVCCRALEANERAPVRPRALQACIGGTTIFSRGPRPL